MIQVYAAIQNRVEIMPHQLLVPSGNKAFMQVLSFKNAHNFSVAYTVAHAPGVTISMEGKCECAVAPPLAGCMLLVCVLR